MDSPFDRRDFLKSAGATLGLLLSRQGLGAAQAPATSGTVPGPAAATPGSPVRVGVIGLGAWGREIVDALGRTDAAQVTAICDLYEPFLKRAGAGAPSAAAVTDWRRVVDSATVDAIVVATPTHLHREIALAALQAGKHVYCEAPLAHSVDDARAIALAANGARGIVFQGGLQGRANPLYRHVRQFVKSGVLGDLVVVNAQWSRKDSWRRAAPTPERERAVNWRLDKDLSTGLAGEISIHQLDLVSQYIGARPAAIVGSGRVAAWRDGRELADTMTCLVDFGAVRADVRATLASSFGGAYTVFQGSNSSLLLKENRGWLIKEADSALLGWEVYARKESVHDETGIAMVADATKLLQAGKEPGKDAPLVPEKPALVHAFEAFVQSVRSGGPSACTAADAYAATVAALNANQAVLGNSRIQVDARDYALV